MTQKVLKVGDSAAVIIPKKSLKELGLNFGDEVIVDVDRKKKSVSIHPSQKMTKRQNRIAELTFNFINRYRKDLIHRWEGYQEEGWFPWLKKELESRGFEVYVPAMPDSAEPKIETWIPFKNKLGGKYKGHFSGSDGVTELLVVLDALLEISK